MTDNFGVYASLMGIDINDDDESEYIQSSDDDRKDPGPYTEKNVVETCVGLARLQVCAEKVKDMTSEKSSLSFLKNGENSNRTNHTNLTTTQKTFASQESQSHPSTILPNLILKDKIFRSTANPVFLARLLREPIIETIYLIVQPWVISKKEFRNGQMDVIQQLIRYGVSFVSTRTSSDVLDMDKNRYIYVEFLLDPFHKQKMEEKKKKEEDMERRKTMRRLAMANKRDDFNSSEEDSESESPEDFSKGISERVNLLSMTMDIEEDEISAFVDERVHFDVILKQCDKTFYTDRLQFYIVNIQK